MSKKQKPQSVNKQVTMPVLTNQAIPLTLDTLSPVQQGAYAIATQLIRVFDNASDKYREYCEYARKHLVPKEAAQILMLAGFRNDEISRIKAVVSLPDPQFKEYQDKRLSFNASLEKARELKAATNGKTRKKKASRFRHVFTSALKIVVKDNTYENSSVVNRTSFVLLAPLVEGREAKYELDGFTLFTRVQSIK